MAVIHQLTGRENNVVSTRCGVTDKVKSTESIPAHTTGWGSQVTCPDCLTPTVTEPDSA